MSFQLILSPVALAADPVDAYTVTGNASDAGEMQFMNSLMMTGSGVVGSSLILCQQGTGNVFPTFSHYIFAGGALVLLLGEIAAAIKQKDNLKESEKQAERMAVVQNTPTADLTQEQKNVQLDALKLAKEEEEKNHEALTARVNWMGAAEIVYWLAVAGAAVEIAVYITTKTLQSSVFPATVAAGNALGYNDWGLTCNNDDKHRAITMGIAAAYGVLGGLNTSTINLGTIMSGAMSTLGAMMMLNMVVGLVGKGLGKVVNTAPGRLVIFGVFAALAEVVRNGFKDRARQAEKNIEAIDRAITAWTNATLGGAEVDTPPDPTTTDGNLGPTAGPPKPLIKRLPRFPKLGKCMGANLEHSAKSCRSPIKFNRSMVKFKSKFLNGAANQAFNMTEAMARDDAAGANGMAAAMGSNAARVKAEAKGLIAEMNAGRVKNGEKPIDFDKEVKAQLASLSKEAMAGAGGGSGAGAGRASLDADEEKSDSESTTGVAAVAAPGAVTQPDADLSLLNSEEVALDGAAADPAAGQSLEDFESSVQDVAAKNDVSIFKQLSNRYILNYTKIFDRKKETSVVPDTPPK